MSYFYRQLILLWAGVVALFLLSGCGEPSDPEPLVLKVGVIASLRGSSGATGQTTVNSARVVADYYNEQGGFEVEGQRYRIELVVADDQGDPVRAVEIVDEFVRAGDIHYVIGPEGDAICEAVSPVLDSAGIFYVYYGFSHPLLAGARCGVLGRPEPMQMFSSIVDYLQVNSEDVSISVLAGSSTAAIDQKLKVERMLKNAGVEVVRFSQFDVSEEVLVLSESPMLIRSRLARLVSENPGVVMLCGHENGTLSLAMSYLRESGYAGTVIGCEPQFSNDYRQIFKMADGLLLVGNSVPITERSDYYLDLKGRYLDLFSEWDVDANTKLYALDSILRGIDQCGRDALTSSVPLLDVIDEVEFLDPFVANERLIGLSHRDSVLPQLRLSIPILISKYNKGQIQAVYRSGLSF